MIKLRLRLNIQNLFDPLNIYLRACLINSENFLLLFLNHWQELNTPPRHWRFHARWNRRLEDTTHTPWWPHRHESLLGAQSIHVATISFLTAQTFLRYKHLPLLSICHCTLHNASRRLCLRLCSTTALKSVSRCPTHQHPTRPLSRQDVRMDCSCLVSTRCSFTRRGQNSCLSTVS